LISEDEALELQAVKVLQWTGWTYFEGRHGSLDFRAFESPAGAVPDVEHVACLLFSVTR
jgi:hypothetical protein